VGKRGQLDPVVEHHAPTGLFMSAKGVAMQPKTKFRVGSTVYLNSGSPPLEVIGQTRTRIHVTWQTESGIPDYDSFPAECLSRHNRKEAS